MAKTQKEIKLPKLPYGQGSMSIRPDGSIMYRKRLGDPKKEYTVYGDTPADAMLKMAELEKDLKNQMFNKKTETLYESMLDWLELYKKPELKKTSYDTLAKTVNARIGKYDIGSIRLDAIDADMIQRHLNQLNTKEQYSYSIIKKCYDALNDFFRHKYLTRQIEYNPMLVVKKINQENVIKETKDICFFERDDIDKFIDEATVLFNGVLKPKHQYGFCLAANIYLGMRVGELLALKWKDVDFDNNTIWIHENLQMVKNPDYDSENEFEMKRKGICKHIYIIQSLKNYQNRHIHMNKKAREYLLLQKQYSDFTNPGDYVCCTRDGKHAAVNYISDNIREIEKISGTKVRKAGTHLLRHTCASLYFRAGVRIELIAALLGHSVDVCRTTYIHFEEEQKKEAVKLLNDYDLVE